MAHKIDAVVYQCEGHEGYSATVPSLPGCFTCGDTIEEVTANVHEAIDSWLKCGDVEGEERPFVGDWEVALTLPPQEEPGKGQCHDPSEVAAPPLGGSVFLQGS